jgi:hypothetical protein
MEGEELFIYFCVALFVCFVTDIEEVKGKYVVVQTHMYFYLDNIGDWDGGCTREEEKTARDLSKKRLKILICFKQ